MLAIIGGSGMAALPALEVVSRKTVNTPYGEPSAPLALGRLNRRDVIFLPRHGEGHRLPPHRINYRANLWALHKAGVIHIIAVATVGGIGSSFNAGTLAIPDQIIDYTWGRAATYFDGEGDGAPDGVPLRHIDFTHPYDEPLRQRLVHAGQRAGETAHAGGTYAVTQGPRLETAAEIARLARDGAHMVGMTGMPEAALARELGIGYATLAVVVNAAAGMGASAQAIDLAQAETLAANLMTRVVRILHEVVTDGD